MDVQAVDLQLLRALLTPELKLAPGRALMARVVEPQTAGARGALSIAGTVIEAELPAHLVAGQEVRLTVREVAADKVILSLAAHSGHAAAAPPPLAPPPLAPPPVPLGEQGRGGGDGEPASAGAGGGAHTVALRYEAGTLGAVDLHFALDAGGLRLTVGLAAGAAHAAGAEAAEALCRALGDALGRPVTVTVTPRADPVDLYA